VAWAMASAPPPLSPLSPVLNGPNGGFAVGVVPLEAPVCRAHERVHGPNALERPPHGKGRKKKDCHGPAKQSPELYSSGLCGHTLSSTALGSVATP